MAKEFLVMYDKNNELQCEMMSIQPISNLYKNRKKNGITDIRVYDFDDDGEPTQLEIQEARKVFVLSNRKQHKVVEFCKYRYARMNAGDEFFYAWLKYAVGA